MLASGLAFSAPTADAAPVDFTHTGSITDVSLAGTAYGDTTFTITARGDTSTRQDNLVLGFNFGFFIPHTSSSITLDGVGTFDFQVETRTILNTVIGTVGFAPTSGEDLVNGPTGASLGTWDMLSSIGPVTGFTVENPNQRSIDTTGGTLSFTVPNADATFTATVVPLPAGGLLLLSALGFGILLRRFA